MVKLIFSTNCWTD